MNTTALPTVIVPIHNALDQLKNCLESLYQTVPKGTEVLLIDDASDDPAIKPFLRSWLGYVGSTWRLEFAPVNTGFVATVNRGMNATGGDVVLLNSDTIVTPGWLQGLSKCLDSDPLIATVTPWTNNGEIASIPHFCQSNPLPPDIVSVAEVIGKTITPVYPDIPTAVGFCMGISRSSIELLGFFDEELFGFGYGEENDFSMRAIDHGMKNVLCDDVYVAHVGGQSFLPKGRKPDEQSMARLLSRHPAYLEKIREFIEADPLAYQREKVLSAISNAGIQWTAKSDGFSMDDESPQ